MGVLSLMQVDAEIYSISTINTDIRSSTLDSKLVVVDPVDARNNLKELPLSVGRGFAMAREIHNRNSLGVARREAAIG